MSKSIIEIIKNHDIVDIIKHYINLNHKGSNYNGVCPFHNDTNPSLVVNNQKRIWKCFSCSLTGDAIKFVQLFTNKNYYDSIIEIAKKIGIDSNLISEFHNNNNIQNNQNEIYYKANKSFIEYCQLFLYNEENKFALDYLTNRGINDEIIKHFKIGYNQSTNLKDLYEILTNDGNKYINLPEDEIYSRDTLLKIDLIKLTKNGNIIDTFNNRIVFSLLDEHNNIIGFSGRSIKNEEPKYLNTQETIIFKKSQILYNWNNLVNNNDIYSLVIVEGFMDVIALYKCGYKNVIATMGTALTQEHIQLLKRKKSIKNIILGFDNDSAGYEANKRIGEKLSSSFNVYVINDYDKQYKDFDELLHQTNEDNVKNVINNQQHFSTFLLNDLFKNVIIDSLSKNDEYYIKSKQIISKYGDHKYLNFYIELLSTNLTIEKNIIEKEIKLLLEQKNNLFQSTENKIIDNQLDSIYSASQLARSTYIKLINSIIDDKNNIAIIQKNYYEFTSNKLFEIHYEFVTLFKLINEFYINNPNLDSINIDNFDSFVEFVKKYNLSHDFTNYIKRIIEHINSTQKIEYNYDNVVNMICFAYKNDLLARNEKLTDIIFESNITDEKNINYHNKINEYRNMIAELGNKRKK